MQKCVIYLIQSKETKEKYVGGTKDYKRRVDDHKYKLLKGTHKNKNLRNHVRVYGISDL